MLSEFLASASPLLKTHVCLVYQTVNLMPSTNIQIIIIYTAIQYF